MPEAISPFTISPTTSQATKQVSFTTVRPAKLTDASQIAVLGATVFSATFGYSLPPSDLSDYLTAAYSITAITSDLTHPSTTTYVVSSTSSSATVLGFAQLTRGTTEPCLENYPKTVELQRLYVSTEAHGLGIGTKLVEMVVKKAREEGFETIWLGVWEENEKARRFYGKVGFEKCGVHDFTMGMCVQTDWIMKMAL